MLGRIEAIISSLTVNIAIIFSSILLMYFFILKGIVSHPPVELKHFDKMKMSKKSRITSGIIFAFACYLLSINSIQIDAWQKVDTRYLLIYFVMYYASTLSGFICGLLFMLMKSIMIIANGYHVLSVEFLNNLIFTSCTLLIAYFCTRDKSKTWRNNLIFITILFIVRAVLLNFYIPFIDLQAWSPNLFSYFLITGGLFIIIFTLIRTTIRLINSIITYKLNAQIDPLTHLFNRSALSEHFNDIMHHNYVGEKEVQTPENLSLCFIDLDSFKEINDEHGHHIGDQILEEFTTIMRYHFETNYQYRFGGDEFVLLFLSDVDLVSQKLQDFITTIQQHTFLAKVKPMKLSISIGLTQTKLTNDVNLQNLLAEADDALYTAKFSGKNKLCTYQNKKEL